MSAAATRVRIAVLTFHRNQDLRELLPMLVEQATSLTGPPSQVDVLVVDNDPGAGARPLVEGLGLPAVTYVAEPRPGIGAARNRALEASADVDLLVFIDDDERPWHGWLEALLTTQLRHGAALVAGRVVSTFAAELDPWIAAGGWFDRRRLPTGTPIGLAATNNLVIDLRQIRRWGLRFDEAFGLTGGEDTLFTRQVAARGGLLVWCDEAVVTDVVPVERLTRRWVVRRAFSSGNSASRVALALSSGRSGRGVARARSLLSGLVRVAGGGVRWVRGAVSGSVAQRSRGVRTVLRGAGMVAGALGHAYQEYRRE
jgi:glycosyltransferase involved in cell wall biosynthesis